jgi:hypothetical protein
VGKLALNITSEDITVPRGAKAQEYYIETEDDIFLLNDHVSLRVLLNIKPDAISDLMHKQEDLDDVEASSDLSSDVKASVSSEFA